MPATSAYLFSDGGQLNGSVRCRVAQAYNDHRLALKASGVLQRVCVHHSALELLLSLEDWLIAHIVVANADHDGVKRFLA